MATLDEMADTLNPKDAAEIREFRDYLILRQRARKTRKALNDIIDAANTNPEPIHYKVREAIDKAREAIRA